MLSSTDVPVAGQGLRPRPVDLVVASLATLLSLSLAARFLGGLDTARAVTVVIALLFHSIALAAFRPAPRPAFLAFLASGGVVVAIGLPTVALGLTPLIAAWYVAASTPLLPGAGMLAVQLLATVWLTSAIQGSSASTVSSNAAAIVTAWTLGRLSAQRTAGILALQQRADALERARTADAERAVAQERLHLAREMHDIIAHGLGAITVQAGAAAHVALPADQAQRTLATIEQLSRRTTDELRGVLGVLRHGGADHAPLPGLDELTELLARTRDTGLDVELEVHGDHRPLSPLAGLAVHRLVQEALTNVRKHTCAPSAVVRLTWTEADVEVEVLDNGPPASGRTVGGLGLAGMRERVEACGGTLATGPRLDASGYRVRATIPCLQTDGRPGVGADAS